MAAKRGPMPTVTVNGETYTLKSKKTVVPDLVRMERFAALRWLCNNTHPRGYSKATNPLRGMCAAISIKVV
jgi:hypothetical protein